MLPVLDNKSLLLLLGNSLHADARIVSRDRVCMYASIPKNIVSEDNRQNTLNVETFNSELSVVFDQNFIFGQRMSVCFFGPSFSLAFGSIPEE